MNVRDLISNVDLQIEISGVVATAVLTALGWGLLALWRYARRKFAERRCTKMAVLDNTTFQIGDILAASRTYVIPFVLEVDPADGTCEDFKQVVKGRTAFDVLDEFIAAPGKSQHMFVLADCGMGKTSLFVNYFFSRYLKLSNSGVKVFLTSLSSGAWVAAMKNIPFEVRAKTVLLLDAFDEDPYVLDGVEGRAKAILREVSGFRQILISCRSHFFKDDASIPVRTDLFRSGPVPAGVSKEYVFSKIYLGPFSEAQVNKFIRAVLPGVMAFALRKRARRLVDKVPFISVRPMLLAHMADIVCKLDDANDLTQYQIYHALAAAWVEREKGWVEPAELLKFSRILALDMYKRKGDRGGEFCTRDEVAALAADFDINIRSEYLAARSLLNRTSLGLCKFSHRSFMEFFFVCGLFDSYGCIDVELTDQMTIFVLERLGVDSSLAMAASKDRVLLDVVSPDVRSGVSTIYSILEEGGQVDAASVYGIIVELNSSRSMKLGEYVQRMLDSSGGRLFEVRVAWGEWSDENGELVVSVWTEECVVIGRVRSARTRLARFFKGREFCSGLVGRPILGRREAAAVDWVECSRPQEGGEAWARISEVCPQVAVRNEDGTLKLTVYDVGNCGLLGFGIVRGVNEKLLRSRDFYVIEAYSVPRRSVGDIVESETVRRAPAEIWDRVGSKLN